MDFPSQIEQKLINSGVVNDKYPYCISFTYFRDKQIIAYGSLNKVIILSNYLTIIQSLCEHEQGHYVTAVSWSQSTGKLMSCGTDLQLNIWAPDKHGWKHLKKYSISYIVNCIGWNFLGTKFCLASEEFSVYEFNSCNLNVSQKLRPIFTESTDTNYCAFSRDSRFILTLQKNNRDIYIWHLNSSNSTEYHRLILTHPSKVISVSWRLSEDVYERCSFMSITKDGIARIWIETCVNERISFHVAASIPCKSIVAGCFIMTTSKMINTNLSAPMNERYANGDGHEQIRDKNTRFCSAADPCEIERNKSLVICLQKDLTITVWQLTGLSLSVRSTPKLKNILSIDKRNLRDLFINSLQLNQRLMPKFSFFIAMYSRKYQLSSRWNFREDEKIKYKRKSIISLVVCDQKSHSLIAVDIVKGSPSPLSLIGLVKSHRSSIKLFKIHDSMPFMISVDEEGIASLWEIEDSDVYDPSLLIHFKRNIGINIKIVDFVKDSTKIIGYSGKSIFLFDYENSNELIPQFNPNFKSKGEILSLSSLYISKESNKIIFITLFSDIFYICSLEEDIVSHLFQLQCEEGDSFVAGVLFYFSSISEESNVFTYKIATKKEIISIKIIIDNDKAKPSIFIKHFLINLEEGEEIVNIKLLRPSAFCILTQHRIYVGREMMSDNNTIDILVMKPLDSDASPKIVSCLSNGFLAISCKNTIQLYFNGRKSNEFTKSFLSLNMFGHVEAEDVSALEWMANGILIYSSQGQIFALTKFMNTYRFDCNIKLPTIHHYLVSLTFSVPDLHSTVITPLALSGRFNLISEMIQYYDEHFDEEDCKILFKKYVLSMPSENNEISKNYEHLNSSINSLITKLMNSNNNIENKRFLYILNKLKIIMDLPSDILDERALIYYRTYLINENIHVPFDIILCAMMSHEKEKLIDLMNIQSWDSVELNGIVYWCDLNKLIEILVSISIRDFRTNRDLSIFFLVLFKRYKALNRLYSNLGDAKRASFFIRDFSTDKNRKAALNNAYSALSKHSYHVSAAMFILAKKFDTALNVCNSNIHDFSISFLVAKLSNDKNIFQKCMKDILIKEAIEKNDLSALSVFENIAYNKEINLSQRMAQTQPGFLYDEMCIWGDVRFCVCEVLEPSLDMHRELARSLLLSGHIFLATQFIDYFKKKDLSCDNIMNGKMPMKKMTYSMSVRNLSNLGMDNLTTDNVEEDSERSNESILVKEINNDHRKRRHSKAKKEIIKPEFDINDVIGNFNYFDDFYDFEEEEGKNEEEEIEEDINVSVSEHQSVLINDNLLVRSHSMNEIPRYYNNSILQKLKEKKELAEDESVELYTSESIQSESDFNSRIILFNILKFRLEIFIEQSVNPEEIEEIVPVLRKEIDAYEQQNTLIQPSLKDFLIGLCKRCSFVYKRLLLLSDTNSKLEYINSLCRSLANLPNLVISHYLTTQQITQISHAIWCLATYYNKELFDQPYQEKRYIHATIMTGFFIVGCYNMNLELLYNLFQPKGSKFPQELIDQVKVEVALPEKDYKLDKLFEHDHDSISFISRKREHNAFSYENISENELYHFMWPLFDMILIDEFAYLIDIIQFEHNKYQNFYTAILKMINLSRQFFIYSILKYPSIMRISSLQNDQIISEDSSLSKLYNFLFKKNKRNERIIAFLKEILGKFSDINPNIFTNVQEKAKLKHKRKIGHFKTGITSFCLYKDKVCAATLKGLNIFNPKAQPTNIAEIESDASNDSNNVNVRFNLDSDESGDESINNESEVEFFSSASLDSLHFTGTKPLFSQFRRKMPRKAYLAVSHPFEDYFLVSDFSGNLYARKYDDSEHFSFFNTSMSTKFTALDFQSAGTMFAAAQSQYVHLYSFCLNNYNKPFVTYNTYGSYVESLSFVQGTGIFATCQKPSIEFNSSVVFWDSILPQNAAMISSIALPKKRGKPIRIRFSPRTKNVFVATNKGSLFVIDTRKYEIVKSIQNAHEKSINALEIDQNERYLVSGGAEGAVKVWDLRSLRMINEMKNVHSPRMVKSKQKLKTVAITDIKIRNDAIYTAGLDGYMYLIDFT